MPAGVNQVSWRLIFSLVSALILLVLFGCGEADAPGNEKEEPASRLAMSGATGEGEALFNTNCSRCHGLGAVGTDQGPPLIHRTYAPGHHPDLSFHNAVRNGVWQHHWSFGEMPPVGTVTPDEVDKVICYVREAQRANGIFDLEEPWTTC